MAVTIARVAGGRKVSGNSQGRWFTITGPASYTTGGEALSASDIAALTAPGGLIGEIFGFIAEPSVAGHEIVLDRTNSKILYFNGTTQIGSGVNLSTITNRVYVERLTNGI